MAWLVTWQPYYDEQEWGEYFDTKEEAMKCR